MVKAKHGGKGKKGRVGMARHGKRRLDQVKKRDKALSNSNHLVSCFPSFSKHMDHPRVPQRVASDSVGLGRGLPWSQAFLEWPVLLLLQTTQ